MMEALQIRQEASQLPASERAELAAFLLSSLDEPHHWVEDEEVAQRTEELNSGEVRGLSLAEFRTACGR